MGHVTFDFAGQTVIVTGAARGIGLAIARRFAQTHAHVIMVDLDETELAAAAASVGTPSVPADISKTADVDRVLAAAIEQTGRIDILVNNAGILRDQVLWKMTDESWERVLAVHAGGTFRLTRACVPYFRAQQFGRVINVTSYTGLHGNRGQANYATAKAGIIGFTKTAAKELAIFGVTVNAISPNAATRMTASIPEEKIADVSGPIARFADPTEITAAVCFLASDDAAYITGSVLPVDGGLSM